MARFNWVPSGWHNTEEYDGKTLEVGMEQDRQEMDPAIARHEGNKIYWPLAESLPAIDIASQEST
jgi:hypothetical protein